MRKERDSTGISGESLDSTMLAHVKGKKMIM